MKSFHYGIWFRVWNLIWFLRVNWVFRVWREIMLFGWYLPPLLGVHVWLLGFSLRGLVDSNFLCRTRNDSLLLPLEVVSSETRVSGDSKAVSSKGDPPHAPSAASRRLWSCVFPNRYEKCRRRVKSGGKDVNIYFKWSILWKWRDRMDAKAPAMSETF